MYRQRNEKVPHALLGCLLLMFVSLVLPPAESRANYQLWHGTYLVESLGHHVSLVVGVSTNSGFCYFENGVDHTFYSCTRACCFLVHRSTEIPRVWYQSLPPAVDTFLLRHHSLWYRFKSQMYCSAKPRTHVQNKIGMD